MPIGLDDRNYVVIYSNHARAAPPTNENAEATFDHAFRVLETCCDDQLGIQRTLWVIDFAGFGLRHVCKRHVVLGCATFGSHNPERLGALVLINPPRTFMALWSFIMRFLDTSSAEKLLVCRDEQEASAYLTKHCTEGTAKWILEASRLTPEVGGNYPSGTDFSLLEQTKWRGPPTPDSLPPPPLPPGLPPSSSPSPKTHTKAASCGGGLGGASSALPGRKHSEGQFAEEEEEEAVVLSSDKGDQRRGHRHHRRPDRSGRGGSEEKVAGAVDLSGVGGSVGGRSGGRSGGSSDSRISSTSSLSSLSSSPLFNGSGGDGFREGANFPVVTGTAAEKSCEHHNGTELDKGGISRKLTLAVTAVDDQANEAAALSSLSSPAMTGEEEEEGEFKGNGGEGGERENDDEDEEVEFASSTDVKKPSATTSRRGRSRQSTSSRNVESTAAAAAAAAEEGEKEAEADSPDGRSPSSSTSPEGRRRRGWRRAGHVAVAIAALSVGIVMF